MNPYLFVWIGIILVQYLALVFLSIKIMDTPCFQMETFFSAPIRFRWVVLHLQLTQPNHLVRQKRPMQIHSTYFSWMVPSCNWESTPIFHILWAVIIFNAVARFVRWQERFGNQRFATSKDHFNPAIASGVPWTKMPLLLKCGKNINTILIFCWLFWQRAKYFRNFLTSVHCLCTCYIEM